MNENPYKTSQEESLEFFKKAMLPNCHEWYGEVILLDTKSTTFYKIAFGSGDNLDDEDTENGFDDYIMVDTFQWDGKRPLAYVWKEIRDTGAVLGLDGIDGLNELDGGQWLLRRKQWKNGDIRRFIMDAIDFAGIVEGSDIKRDFIVVE